MLILVKTIGGGIGSPSKCLSCKSEHFVKTGIAWSCSDCGLYIPVDFGKSTPEKLQKDLENLSNSHVQFKRMIDELERIVE